MNAKERDELISKVRRLAAQMQADGWLSVATILTDLVDELERNAMLEVPQYRLFLHGTVGMPSSFSKPTARLDEVKLLALEVGHDEEEKTIQRRMVALGNWQTYEGE